MNEIRLSKEMKFMLLQLMAYGDTPKRMAKILFDEFVYYNNFDGTVNPKLLKETIRLLKHCDNYWGGGYAEEFMAELNKLSLELESAGGVAV